MLILYGKEMYNENLNHAGLNKSCFKKKTSSPRCTPGKLSLLCDQFLSSKAP